MTEDNKKYIFSELHNSLYVTAYKMFLDNKTLGVGVKNFRKFCSNEKYYTNQFSCNTHPHNTYIQLLSETGVVGFLFIFFIFLFLCLKFAKMVCKKFFLNSYIDPIKVCLLVSFIITLWPIIPTGNFFHNWLNVIFYLPLGFFLWINEKERTNKKL